MHIVERKIRHRVIVNIDQFEKKIKVTVFPTMECWSDVIPNDESYVYDHGTISLFVDEKYTEEMVYQKVNNALNRYRRTCVELADQFASYVEAIDNYNL